MTCNPPAIELIDAHSYLDFDDLDHDIDTILARSIAAGVTELATVGADLKECRKAIDLQKDSTIYTLLENLTCTKRF